jgi:hypothetical protein
VAVAAGQPIGQPQIGQDDPLSQRRVAAGGVLAQPPLNVGRGVLVAGANIQDGVVGNLGDGGGHRGTSLDWSSTRARWTGQRQQLANSSPV